MNKIDRYKILMRYIKNVGIAPSQKAFGRLMGYNNESYFSQIINGQVDEPKDFIKKLQELVPSINVEWLKTGTGDMIIGSPSFEQTNRNGDNIQGNHVEVNKTDSGKLVDVILQQSAQLTKSQEQLSKSQEQIDRLITIIEQIKK